MRRLALSNKKLRGIPRRLRALEQWASSFRGLYYPQPEEAERFIHWKIPVHAALVEGAQARIEWQAFCVQQLLEATAHLSRAAERTQGYYRVACLLTWPWLFESEVTVFYDREYYLGFMGHENTLAPQRLSERLALDVHEPFIEHGHDITQIYDEAAVQWWCIGEPV